jgi:hypothetical protein
VVENIPDPLSPLFDELYLREGLELSIDSMMAFFRMAYFRVEDFVDRPLFTTNNGYAYTELPERLSGVEGRLGHSRVQGTVARSGEVLLLSLEDHKGDSMR